MTLLELDDYFNSFLHKELYQGDSSLNGIQIQNAEPSSKQIKKIAFAVDACEYTTKKAIELGADLLFVHHGLFWGECKTITGTLYNRLNNFIKNDIALCAYHLPLDANNPYGNNWGLANRLELKNCNTFAQWKDKPLGVYGTLPQSLTIEDLAKKLMLNGKQPRSIINLGKEKIQTVGIVSGGASESVFEAIDLGLDCFITGEFLHQDYHYAKEAHINVIAGGHYETETVGVSLVMQKVQKELGIETVFVESPTNL